MTEENPTPALVEHSKNGDRAAFDQLIERYQGRVGRYLGSKLGERLQRHVDVDDLVQDVFLRALRSLQDFHWQNEKAFEGWLFRIAEHVVLYAAQKHRRPETSVPDDLVTDEPSPTKRMQRDERFDRLENAVRSLPPEYREVILLAKIERLKIREIAASTGRTEDAVKQLLARGLRKLKASFGDTESLNLPDRHLGQDATHSPPRDLDE